MHEFMYMSIVQDFLLHLKKKLVKFDSSKKFDPWLYKVVHNFCLDWVRRVKNIKLKEENTFEEESFIQNIQSYDGSDIPGDVELKYKDALLKVALYKLGERNRELLLLYYFEYSSYDEIADIMGVKSSGVGALLARAKKELKQKIDANTMLKEAIIYDLD